MRPENLPRGQGWAVQRAYWDVQGRLRRASPEALRAVLDALGTDPQAPPPAVGPVTVAWDGRTRFVLRVPRLPQRVRCQVFLEDGRERSWGELRISGVRRAGPQVGVRATLPARLPWGVHRAVLEVDGQHQHTVVLAAPSRLGPVQVPGLAVWVPAYGLWSRGEGAQADFGLLRQAGRWLRERGVGVLATVPLFSSLLDEPFEPSPYLPASRLFWNELFVHLPGEPDVPVSGELVDYRDLFARRRARLQEAWRQLSDREKEQVRGWARGRPWSLEYGRFRALLDVQRRPWRRWPEPWRCGTLPEGEVDPQGWEAYVFAQWLATEQLQKVAEDLWLYLDLPLGVHPDGFDAWRFREVFVEGVSVGAPPDPFARHGQDWSFPPPHPQRMRQDGYAYLRAVLRRVFEVARMVRLDHVMALHRLYWIPRGFSPAEGVYVRYPADELYAAVLLEAARAGAVVVGEDLGTVPGEVRRALDRRGLWRMYVLLFEAAAPHPRRPGRTTVASFGTHDTATFAGLWTGADLEERARLGLVPTEAMAAERRREQVLRENLARCVGAPVESPARAFHAALRWLAVGPAGCVLVQLEDLWLEVLRHNLPGTAGEVYPNWRRRLRYAVEDWDQLPGVSEILEELAQVRSGAR